MSFVTPPFLISLCIFSKGPCLSRFVCYHSFFLFQLFVHPFLLPLHYLIFSHSCFHCCLHFEKDLCFPSPAVICFKNNRTFPKMLFWISDLINTFDCIFCLFLFSVSYMLFHTSFSLVYLITSIFFSSLPSTGGPPQWELKAVSSLFLLS